MQSARSPRPQVWAAALASGALLASLAVAASPPGSSPSPVQVARTLDTIVQPRFQQNAGKFGMDRVVSLDGHSTVHYMDPENNRERRLFRQVKTSRRPYVVAFLHCRHKPGAHVNPKTPPEKQTDFKPSVSTLVAIGATQKGTDHLYDWAGDHLEKIVLPYLPQLRQGRPQQAEYQNWVVVMRPVRAEHEACLSCHAGAKRGDTLGVMVYAVDKNPKIVGESYSAPGGP